MDDHKIPLEELEIRLTTNFKQGLSDSVAAHKNRQFGDNKLTEKKKTPWWVNLLKEMI